MRDINELEDLIRENISGNELNKVLNQISIIAYYINNLENENKDLKRKVNNQEITIQSKEDVIKMLSRMIRGVIDE